MSQDVIRWNGDTAEAVCARAQTVLTALRDLIAQLRRILAQMTASGGSLARKTSRLNAQLRLMLALEARVEHFVRGLREAIDTMESAEKGLASLFGGEPEARRFPPLDPSDLPPFVTYPADDWDGRPTGTIGLLGELFRRGEDRPVFPPVADQSEAVRVALHFGGRVAQEIPAPAQPAQPTEGVSLPPTADRADHLIGALHSVVLPAPSGAADRPAYAVPLAMWEQE